MFIEELDECFELRKRVQDISDRIEELELRIRAPKAQPFSDMPHGTSRTNPLERYITKKEELEVKKHTVEMQLDEKWGETSRLFTDSGATKQELDLLRLRFFYGKPWKECTATMNKIYGNWNDNASFRAYRKAVERLKKCG